MKKFNVAILGATGAVGLEMLKVLEERNFPINDLKLLASKKSVGKVIKYANKDYYVEEATDDAFKGMDIVLGAAQNAIAKRFKDAIVASGAVFIDNSSAFRMDEDVPLVVPEINKEDIYKNKGVISNPNCSTIITLVAINAINKLSEIEAIVATTYQATSGAGIEGPKELLNQMGVYVDEYRKTGNAYSTLDVEGSVFQYPIACNVIPHIGSFLDNGFTTEEMKMQNEGRKIMHLPNLLVNCTCVRVPVIRSHSIAVTLYTKEKLELDAVRYALLTAKGVRLYDKPEEKLYPMPIVTSDQDIVFVGRLRKDLINEKGLSLWCCGDQVRKGAATNAIQIAEGLIEKL